MQSVVTSFASSTILTIFAGCLHQCNRNDWLGVKASESPTDDPAVHWHKLRREHSPGCPAIESGAICTMSFTFRLQLSNKAFKAENLKFKLFLWRFLIQLLPEAERLGVALVWFRCMQVDGAHKCADYVMPVKHVVLQEQLTTTDLSRELASP